MYSIHIPSHCYYSSSVWDSLLKQRGFHGMGFNIFFHLRSLDLGQLSGHCLIACNRSSLFQPHKSVTESKLIFSKCIFLKKNTIYFGKKTTGIFFAILIINNLQPGNIWMHNPTCNTNILPTKPWLLASRRVSMIFWPKVLSLEGVGPGPLMGVKGVRLEDVVYELSQTVRIDDIPIICHVLMMYRIISNYWVRLPKLDDKTIKLKLTKKIWVSFGIAQPGPLRRWRKFRGGETETYAVVRNQRSSKPQMIEWW